MARHLSTLDISWFLDLNDKGQLNLDPPYQRRSVWSPKDKRFFIDTILNGYPAPPIFLHKTLEESGRATYHVVDGKQRLKTIIDFVDNKIRIPDDFSNIDLQKKRWNDLDRSYRETFWNYILIVEMIPDASEVSIKNIFERINRNSRKLMPQELRHAKYDGWFINEAESEAEKQEWKDFGMVTSARTKRMSDVQFVSELMSVTIKNEIEGFDQDRLDDICAEFDDLLDQSTFVLEDYKRKFENTKAYIKQSILIAPPVSELIKIQVHFYTLWSYLTLDTSRLLSADIFAPKYNKFLSDVSSYISGNFSINGEPSSYDQAVISYANNTKGASTDLPQRNARYRALVTAIHGDEVVRDENSSTNS